MLEFFSDYLKLLSKGGCDDGHREGSVLRRSQSSKLKLMASICIRRSSVAISILLVYIMRQTENLLFQVLFNWRLLAVNDGAYSLPKVG